MSKSVSMTLLLHTSVLIRQKTPNQSLKTFFERFFYCDNSILFHSKLYDTANLRGGFKDMSRNKKKHFSTSASCLQSIVNRQSWLNYHFWWKFCLVLFKILLKRKQGHFSHFDIVNRETFKKNPQRHREAKCHAGAIWEGRGHPQWTSRGIIHNSFPAVTEMVNTKGQWRSMQEKH